MSRLPRGVLRVRVRACLRCQAQPRGKRGDHPGAFLSKPSITLNCYGHMMEGADEAAAKAIEGC